MACIDFEALGFSRTEVENMIDEFILSERDRNLMKRRHLDGICFEKLAEEYEISVRQAKKIIYSCDQSIYTKNARK